MTVVAVLVGAIAGTALRLGLDALLPHAGAAFPWSTLVINIVGAAALGYLVARVWPAAPGWLRAGLGPGLLGSFTTFSAVAVSVVELTDAGAAPLALLYLAVTLGAGLSAAWAGLLLGSRPRQRYPISRKLPDTGSRSGDPVALGDQPAPGADE